MGDDERAMGWLGRTWVAGVVAYAVARAVVVWPTLGDKGVNPWVFLVIDVGTAWPYAVGQVHIIKGIRAGEWSRVQRWTLVTLASFLAPYVYVFVAGAGELPGVAYASIFLLIAVFGAASIARIIRGVKAEDEPVGP